MRPDHLEAVAFAENIHRGNGLAAENAAKTHCPQGHPYDEANTYVTPEGWRVCRECLRNRDAKKRKAARGVRFEQHGQYQDGAA